MNNPSGTARQLRRVLVAPRMLARTLAWGMPKRSLVFGPLSLGDDLLCTAVLHEARERGKPFAMFTRRPELFLNNPAPYCIHPIDDHYLNLLRKLGRQVCSPYYVTADPLDQDRDVLPDRHVIAEMCRLAGLHGPVKLRPYFFLNDAERARAPHHARQIVLQSSGLAAAIPYKNKEWGASRFATVADKLRGEFQLIQIGSASDPALPVQIDLRGKTSLREAAAILANSLAFVGLEGFLTHLARAVDCRSIVVIGGRATPGVFNYAGNVNLFTQEPCSPCGLRSTCPHELACMTKITPDIVIDAVHQVVKQHGQPLPVETANLP